MSQQSRYRGVLASQLSLGQQGMDLTVTDAVHERGLSPALAFGDEVVGIALCRRYRAATQRARWGRQRRGVNHIAFYFKGPVQSVQSADRGLMYCG
jgi:hypothetical protein